MTCPERSASPPSIVIIKHLDFPVLRVLGIGLVEELERITFVTVVVVENTLQVQGLTIDVAGKQNGIGNIGKQLIYRLTDVQEFCDVVEMVFKLKTLGGEIFQDRVVVGIDAGMVSEEGFDAVFVHEEGGCGKIRIFKKRVIGSTD